MSDEASDREERIRTRAYFLWQEAGCPEGCAEDHWQQARAEEDAAVDEASMESFPASDPSAHRGITGIARG